MVVECFTFQISLISSIENAKIRNCDQSMPDPRYFKTGPVYSIDWLHESI